MAVYGVWGTPYAMRCEPEEYLQQNRTFSRSQSVLLLLDDVRRGVKRSTFPGFTEATQAGLVSWCSENIIITMSGWSNSSSIPYTIPYNTIREKNSILTIPHLNIILLLYLSWCCRFWCSILSSLLDSSQFLDNHYLLSRIPLFPLSEFCELWQHV